MPADKHAETDHQDQARKDAPDAMRIELAKRKAVGCEAFENDRRYQETRNDEEDVDAEVPAGKRRGGEVKGDDRQDGDDPRTGSLPKGEPATNVSFSAHHLVASNTTNGF